jgi:hypothetical protein
VAACGIDSKRISHPKSTIKPKRSSTRRRAFVRLQREDSFFLPRCGHGLRSLFGPGPDNGEIAQMTIKACKPAAWILAAGLLACMGMPSFAGEASPWPTTTGVTASDGQQAATSAATYQAGAAAQSDAADRSLSPDQRPADAVASVEATDPNATQVRASSEDGGGWDKASIVGKIFIAAGTLLTLGSAARMFMI